MKVTLNFALILLSIQSTSVYKTNVCIVQSGFWSLQNVTNHDNTHVENNKEQANPMSTLTSSQLAKLKKKYSSHATAIRFTW